MGKIIVNADGFKSQKVDPWIAFSIEISDCVLLSDLWPYREFCAINRVATPWLMVWVNTLDLVIEADDECKLVSPPNFQNHKDTGLHVSV